MKPKKETERQTLAFEFFWELGDKRTKAAVKRRFRVSERTVMKWAKVHRWDRRVTERKERIAAQLAEAIEQKEIDIQGEVQAINRAVRVLVARGLNTDADKRNGARQLHPDLKDFVNTAKLDLLIEGKPTERIALATETLQEVVGKIVGVIAREVKDQEVRERIADGIEKIVSDLKGAADASSNAPTS